MSLSAPNSTNAWAAGKVPLGPGRSLMDWIRNQPKQAPPRREVSMEELRAHSTPADCWLAVRDIVYDVTPYIEYHPGGVDQILRGAGQDATDLFNQYHSWVNVENMLKTCIVGKLVRSQFKVPISTALKFDTGLPGFDWLQDDNSIKLSVSTNRELFLRKEYIVTIKTDDNQVKIFIFLDTECYFLGYTLEKKIRDIGVDVREGKFVTITLFKETPGPWKKVGSPFPNNRSLTPSKSLLKTNISAKLTKISQLNHNCYQFSFAIDPNVKMTVPIGRHVTINLPKNLRLARPYTPVPSKLTELHRPGAIVDLMIKIYPDGNFTPNLRGLQVGEDVLMGIPEGDFSLKSLQDAESLILLAAGTGITPMLKIINYCLFESFLETRVVNLMFFNKTAEDIVYRDQLEELQEKFADNFVVKHVLSEAEGDANWKGERGRISGSLLKANYPQLSTSFSDDDFNFVYICGPTAFTNSTVTHLEKLGVSNTRIVPFQG